MATAAEERIRIIVNGKVAGDELLRAAVGEFRARGFDIEVRVTWEGGDAGRYTIEAVEDGVGTIVAAGGDGSLSEVVAGIIEVGVDPAPRVGVIPFGTANDFANCCMIPPAEPAAALELVTTLEPTLIDVGVVNGRSFVNVASGGLGAEVTANTPPEMKRALGGAAYSLMALLSALNVTPWQTRITVGDETFDGMMVVMAVGNGRLAGGGYQVAPNALLNDGLLDLIAIRDFELPRFGTLLGELNDVCNDANTCVHYWQRESFIVESAQPVPWNLDGEPITGKRFEFSVLPARIPLILPPGAPVAQDDVRQDA
ncbi:putative lipid kinase YegS [Maioricimonas rarisocia]|uniref:Putative lipid kinase YegS n=1 Tax=Maioricimonas rarisocia TaxID=2528026 RepID=A0A517Z525_9PLAN|nr:lipid kinase YegS [Maioricimonas rarisocia]QDU37547.1 putative lipid kinase YegS [Maioricimonas rarisocia]